MKAGVEFMEENAGGRGVRLSETGPSKAKITVVAFSAMSEV